MKIVDYRNEFAGLAGPDVLKPALALVDKRTLIGISELRLFDYDSRASKHGRPAYGRYVFTKSSRQGDIELYYWRFNDLPDELRHSPLYQTFILMRTFVHEVNHHWIHNRRLRKPKRQKEERIANSAGQKVASMIIHRLFPRADYPREWEEMEAAIKRWQSGSGTATGAQ